MTTCPTCHQPATTRDGFDRRGRQRFACRCAVNRVCVISLSGAVVLMEQTTKTISALHRTGRQRDHAG